MVRSSYRKLLKQERAKVKLKDKDKKLLPKGQNVTDLNFKVKKIVIKSQLKEHTQDEILSTRKLNIQEVLSRLNHYSGSVSTEAVNQLESLLKSGGKAFLSTHMTTVVSSLAKLLTSSHSHLRKAAIKLLANILTQVEESEWAVLRGKLVSYIICGLSHVEPGVRSDSLLALEALPSTLSLPAEALLPSLLDLVSTSKQSGSRLLSTPLSSSPTAYRAAVLRRIAAILSSLCPPPKYGKGEDEGNDKETLYKLTDEVRVPLTSYYPLQQEQALSISEFSSSSQLSNSQTFDIQEFVGSLVPLMLDAYAEVAPEPDEREAVCRLNEEGFKFLATVADVLLLVNDILYGKATYKGNWFRDKLGGEVFRRLIEGRFPYSEGPVSSKKQHQPRPSTLKLNLTLAVLAQTLAPHYPGSSRLVSHFLIDMLRGRQKVGAEESSLFKRCLSLCLSKTSSDHTSHLLASLTRLTRDKDGMYDEVFSVLRKVVVNGSRHDEVSGWLENLLTELADPDSGFPRDTLDLLVEAAPSMTLPLLFHTTFSFILSKALERNVDEELWLMCNLVYWVKMCDRNLLDVLQRLVNTRSYLSTHLVNLLSHKCERYPETEMNRLIKQHPFWKHKLPLLLAGKL